MNGTRICSEPDCGGRFLARGMCNKHYKRWQEGGPAGGTTDLMRFERQVTKTDGCWFWQGFIMPNGYGRATVGGRRTYAHRAALMLYRNESLEGVSVDHSCWHRHCVNPAHLRPVTTRLNNENRSADSVSSASGHRGVTWDRSRNKWAARVKSGGVAHNLGRFDNIDDAIRAAVAGRARLFTNYVEHELLANTPPAK